MQQSPLGAKTGVHVCQKKQKKKTHRFNNILITPGMTFSSKNIRFQYGAFGLDTNDTTKV